MICIYLILIIIFIIYLRSYNLYNFSTNVINQINEDRSKGRLIDLVSMRDKAAVSIQAD